VQIERATGLFLFGRVQVADVLRLPVGKTIGIGGLLILSARGPLARRPKIDQFSHSAPRYFGRAGQKISPVNAAIDDNCAESRAGTFPLEAGDSFRVAESRKYNVSPTRAVQYTVS